MVLKHLSNGREITDPTQPRKRVGVIYDDIDWSVNSTTYEAVYTFSANDFVGFNATTRPDIAANINFRLSGSMKTGNGTETGIDSIEAIPDSDFEEISTETGVASTDNFRAHDMEPGNGSYLLARLPYRTYRIFIARQSGSGAVPGTLYIKGTLLHSSR